MGKQTRRIKKLINPEVEQDLTRETLGNIKSMFSGQRNELSDINARQNVGADAEAARTRRSFLDQSGAESGALANLQKLFQDMRFKQMSLFLQNKGLNIQKEIGESSSNPLGMGLQGFGFGAGLGLFSKAPAVAAPAVAAVASDRRLKNNIKPLGDGVYSWDWNKEAEKHFGLTGSSTGEIAQYVDPLRVIIHESGYLMIRK